MARTCCAETEIFGFTGVTVSASGPVITLTGPPSILPLQVTTSVTAATRGQNHTEQINTGGNAPNNTLSIIRLMALGDVLGPPPCSGRCRARAIGIFPSSHRPFLLRC